MNVNNIDRKPTLGIYPGSFNPFHLGHLDILNQAVEVFESVIIAKGINPSKSSKEYNDKYPLPRKFLEQNPKVKVGSYDTLLIDYIKKHEIENSVTIIRGLRNGSDLEYEQNIVAFLRSMHPKIKVIAFYCDPRYRHISSSALRDIQKFSESEYRKYIVED